MSWPFELLDPAEDFDEASYVALLARLRGFLDALAGASPDPALTSRLTADLGRWQALLAERAATEPRAPYGQLHAADDHGLAAVPAVEVHAEAPGRLDATVRFSRWFVGGGGAVHGGHLATTLDGLMGRTQRVEGRKHFLHGRLSGGGTTYVEAEALFVRVAPYPAAARGTRTGTLEAS